MSEHEADPIRGLAASEEGLTLTLARTSLDRGEAAELRFTHRRLQRAGQGLRGHAREADAPDRRAPRRHRLPAPAPGPRSGRHVARRRSRSRTPGAYRVYADFARNGEAHTLAADLTVDGDADYAPFPQPTTTDTTDGYTVELKPDGARARLRDHQGRRAGHDRAVPRRRRPPGRAARGRSRLPARAPRRRRPELRGRPRPGLPLPPVPAVQARRHGPHRGVHAMSTDDRAADHGHDVRVVREPDRAQAEQARRRQRVA